jgi:hypothetical protein
LKSPGSSGALIITVAVIIVVVVAAAAVAWVYYLSPIVSPKTETESLSFSGFTSVEVSSSFRVTLTQSSNYSVTVTANQKIFDLIEVNQIGSTLKISMRPGTFSGTADLSAQITMPELRNVTLSGATSGTAAGFRSAQPFAVQLSGASSLQLTGFQSGNITADISEASSLKASGAAGDLVSVVSGASSLDLSGLAVNDASVNLSGASHAQVDVGGRLDAQVTEASSLQYSGDPTLGSIITSGASSVGRS